MGNIQIYNVARKTESFVYVNAKKIKARGAKFSRGECYLIRA